MTTRRLAAILAADVVGFSSMMEKDEEGTLRRVKALQREVIEPKVRERDGRLVKTTGDGFLCEFGSPVEAVRCAVEVQDATKENGDSDLLLRMGINLGDIIVEPDGDIYGDGVNIAARLEQLADPGSVWISGSVYEHVQGKIGVKFETKGERQVKNINRPVQVFTLNQGAAAHVEPTAARVVAPEVGPTRGGFWSRVVRGLTGSVAAGCDKPPPKSHEPQKTGLASEFRAEETGRRAPRLSIIVLPFANLSPEREEDYFADGITEDLTTDLSRITGSLVIARNTAFTYKGKSVDVRQLGRELRVRYVLEGSVRRSGNQVRINAQLIDAETASHVWAERFDIDRQSLAGAQTEITGRIARTLNVELIVAESRKIEQQKRTSPDALDYAMRGWAAFYRPMTPDNRAEARRHFERALEIDPSATDALIGLSFVIAANLASGQSTCREEDMRLAKSLYPRALENDPNHPTAHYVRALVARAEGRLDDAAEALSTALSFDENFATAYFQLGNVLNFLGRPEEGIPLLQKSLRLSPKDSYVPLALWSLAYAHLMLDQLDLAIEHFRRAIGLKLWFFHLDYGATLALKGDMEAARREFSDHLRLKPEFDTLAKISAGVHWITANEQHWRMRERTLNEGLRRIGMPET